MISSVCVDFFATWCPPCRMIAPILGGMAREYEGKCAFYKVSHQNRSSLSHACLQQHNCLQQHVTNMN